MLNGRAQMDSNGLKNFDIFFAGKHLQLAKNRV